jgi:hypothetical protein
VQSPSIKNHNYNSLSTITWETKMMGGQGHGGLFNISVRSTKKQPLAKDKGPLEGDRLPPITLHRTLFAKRKLKGILVAYS